MLKKDAFVFSLLLAVLAFLLFNPLPAEAAIAPPISSGCSWTSGDTYSCGGSTTSTASTYTCTNGVKSTTSKCSTDCGSASSCDSITAGSDSGLCNSNTGRKQTCDSSCQIVDSALCGNCKSSSCEGITPGSYTTYCNNEAHRKQYCDSTCTIREGTICCNGAESCNSYSPGKTYCQSTTNKLQTCNNDCGLDTATACVKDVCSAECIAGDTITTGCPAGQQKSCDTTNCKWGACKTITEVTLPPCTDNDADGYGSPASTGCAHPELDCNDADASLHALNTCGACATEPAGGCSSSVSCSDGIQNQDETDVDCGGTKCAACTVTPTCSDGIQNQGETGVDCGGTNCAACQTTTASGTCSGVCVAYSETTGGTCPAGYGSGYIGPPSCASGQMCCTLKVASSCSPVGCTASKPGYCDGSSVTANCGACGCSYSTQICQEDGNCATVPACDGISDADLYKGCCEALGFSWLKSGEITANEPAAGKKDVFYSWTQGGYGSVESAVSDLKLNGWGSNVVLHGPGTFTAVTAGGNVFGHSSLTGVKQLVAGDAVYRVWVRTSTFTDSSDNDVSSDEVWINTVRRDGSFLTTHRKIAGDSVGYDFSEKSLQINYDSASGKVWYGWYDFGEKQFVVTDGTAFSYFKHGRNDGSISVSIKKYGFSAFVYDSVPYFVWKEDLGYSGRTTIQAGIGFAGRDSLFIKELASSASSVAGYVPGAVLSQGSPSVQVADGKVYYAWPVQLRTGWFEVASDVRLASSNLDGSDFKAVDFLKDAGLTGVTSLGGANVDFKVVGGKIYVLNYPVGNYAYVVAADAATLRISSPWFVHSADFGYTLGYQLSSVGFDAAGGNVYLFYTRATPFYSVNSDTGGQYVSSISFSLMTDVVDGSTRRVVDKVERKLQNSVPSRLQLQVAQDTRQGLSASVDTQFYSDSRDRKAARGSRLGPDQSSCIGDDNPEIFPGRRKEGIAASVGDAAICDKLSDCVFNKRCYSDIDAVASTFFGGNVFAAWSSSGWKSEVSADVNADGKVEVCDPGQWVNPSGSIVGFVTDASGSGLASAVVDAVSTSQPVTSYSAVSASDGSYSIGSVEPANYDVTASKSGYTTQTWSNVPVQPFQVVQRDFELSVASVAVSGVVRNASRSNSNGPCPSGCPVAGAVVSIVGTGFSAVTAADGSYSIAGVPIGYYDIVAGKPSDSYVDAVKVEVGVVFDVDADFTLVKALDGCNNDCTKADGFCHAECGGKGLCVFESPETASACDFAAPGIITDPDDPSMQVICCSGSSYSPVKADMSVPTAKNVLITKKPVLYKGRFLNMVIVTFTK